MCLLSLSSLSCGQPNAPVSEAQWAAVRHIFPASVFGEARSDRAGEVSWEVAGRARAAEMRCADERVIFRARAATTSRLLG